MTLKYENANLTQNRSKHVTKHKYKMKLNKRTLFKNVKTILSRCIPILSFVGEISSQTFMISKLKHVAFIASEIVLAS